MEIVINQVSFSLPCKSFIVDYSVSQKRQLPVVKEFVVRLLFSLGSCNPSLLSDFYGFNIEELEYVLNDLTEERLIEWTDQSVALTKYAQEKFEVITGGKLVPRFFEVQDEIKNILFELYSFKILYSSFKPESRSPLGVDIPLLKGSHNNIRERVKSSFDDQFLLYQERVQNLDIYKDCPELYKINHITANYDAILPVEMIYSIQVDAPKNVILKYGNNTIDEWDNQHVLFKAMDEALLGNVCVNDGIVDDFNAYIRLTDDPFIIKYWTAKNEIDINALIPNYAIEHNIWDSKSTRMLVGNIYTQNNSSIILEMIEQKKKDEFLDAKISEGGAIWIVEPENKTWGRTSEFISFTTKINELFDQRKKSTTGIAIVMPCTSKNNAGNLDIYSFATDNKVKLQGVDSSFISEKIEIFYIPNVVMVCLFHYGLADNRKLTLPIGFVTTNASKMIRVNYEVERWLKSENMTNNFFEPMHKDKKHTVLNTLIYPTIGILTGIENI